MSKTTHQMHPSSGPSLSSMTPYLMCRAQHMVGLNRHALNECIDGLAHGGRGLSKGSHSKRTAFFADAKPEERGLPWWRSG